MMKVASERREFSMVVRDREKKRTEGPEKNLNDPTSF